MDVEARITEWREHVGRSRAIAEPDVDELETHLRDQMDDLTAVGLSSEEAFTVAVMRVGHLDSVSREYAREHTGRLWKHLVIVTEPTEGRSSPLVEAIAFALAAGVAVHLPRLFGLGPGEPEGSMFYPRNLSLLVLPFLALYLARRHGLRGRKGLIAGFGFAAGAVLVNSYPWARDSSTEIQSIIHLPVAMWFLVGLAYTGGEWRSHQRRMDFVRFTGESFIYYVLIALGGGVLIGLTAFILEPLTPSFVDEGLPWFVMSGAAGAVVIVGWLAEWKQSVVENMAPVLTKIFTPLFGLMLIGAAVTYAVSGIGREFDRDLLAVFDLLMLVVLGLVLYALSAADSDQPAGLFDRIQLVTVVGALALDLMVLGSMIARIADFGFTPNRVVALGINLLLLFNLLWTARLSLRFLRGRSTLHQLEAWQMAYLPVFGAWAAFVVVLLPLLFRFA